MPNQPRKTTTPTRRPYQRPTDDAVLDTLSTLRDGFTLKAPALALLSDVLLHGRPTAPRSHWMRVHGLPELRAAGIAPSPCGIRQAEREARARLAIDAAFAQAGGAR